MKVLFLNYLYNEGLLSWIILVLLILSILFFKRYTAKSRYYMWIIVLIALIIPYRLPNEKALWQVNITSLTQNFPEIDKGQINYQPHTYPSDEGAHFQQSFNSQGRSDTVTAISYKSFSVIDYLMMIWLAGAIISISFMILTHRHFMRCSDKWCEPIKDSKIEMIVGELQKKYQLFDLVQIKYCKLLNTPITIGLFHPMILLPCIEFDDQELYLILSHEMIHCKRKDIWYKLFINIVVAIHWYNPIIYLMRNRIYLECEVSCDEEVLAGHDAETRLQYGEIIIDVIRHQNARISPLTSAFFLEKKKIKERLSNIMNNNLKQEGTKVMAGVALAAVLSINLLGFSYDQIPVVESDQDIKQNEVTQRAADNIKKNRALQTPKKKTDNALILNGGIAPNLTENIGMITMKKSETITFSLQDKISDPMSHILSESITVLIVDTDHHISSLQLNNQCTSKTFTASKGDTYLIALQNGTQQLLNYIVKCTTTSNSKIVPPSGDQQLSASMPAQNNQVIGNNRRDYVNGSYQPQQQVPAVTDDASAKKYYKNTGSISAIVNNLDVVSQDVLDSILIDYIKNTNDIGTLFLAIDYLSQSTIDTIVTDYIKRTNDIGIVFSAMSNLSQEAIDQIAKNYAANNNDQGMIETLKPYVSDGVLG